MLLYDTFGDLKGFVELVSVGLFIFAKLFPTRQLWVRSIQGSKMIFAICVILGFLRGLAHILIFWKYISLVWMLPRWLFVHGDREREMSLRCPFFCTRLLSYPRRWRWAPSRGLRTWRRPRLGNSRHTPRWDPVVIYSGRYGAAHRSLFTRT